MVSKSSVLHSFCICLINKLIPVTSMTPGQKRKGNALQWWVWAFLENSIMKLLPWGVASCFGRFIQLESFLWNLRFSRYMTTSWEGKDRTAWRPNLISTFIHITSSYTLSRLGRKHHLIHRTALTCVMLACHLFALFKLHFWNGGVANRQTNRGAKQDSIFWLVK